MSVGSILDFPETNATFQLSFVENIHPADVRLLSHVFPTRKHISVAPMDSTWATFSDPLSPNLTALRGAKSVRPGLGRIAIYVSEVKNICTSSALFGTNVYMMSVSLNEILPSLDILFDTASARSAPRYSDRGSEDSSTEDVMFDELLVIEWEDPQRQKELYVTVGRQKLEVRHRWTCDFAAFRSSNPCG